MTYRQPHSPLRQPSSGQTTCPVPACPAQHSRRLLMCKAHWNALPKPLRDEVWRAFREEGVMSDAYQQARDEAIRVAAGG